MPAVLQTISNRGMLAALGFNCGRVILEDGGVFYFCFQGQGIKLAMKLLDEGRVSADEAEGLCRGADVAEPYFAANLDEVFAAAAAMDDGIPKRSEWGFRVCQECPLSIPHGYILLLGQDTHNEPIISLERGFGYLQGTTLATDKLSSVRAIALLRQMMAAGLLKTEEGAEKITRVSPKNLAEALHRLFSVALGADRFDFLSREEDVAAGDQRHPPEVLDTEGTAEKKQQLHPPEFFPSGRS